jgi:inosine/xanthosine triphosphate pyrophosphatase family protein
MAVVIVTSWNEDTLREATEILSRAGLEVRATSERLSVETIREINEMGERLSKMATQEGK